MLKLNTECTYTGDRESNLDRIGHFSGNNWSISYMLDGFFVCEPHYVDSLVEKIKVLIKTIPLCVELENLIKVISTSLEDKTISQGKASAVFVLSLDDKVRIFHAGDTRYYILEKNIRSKDHSQAQRMVDDKKSPQKSLYKHPYRKYLTRSISSGSSISSLEEIEFNSINSLILCSDGFWSCFESEEEIYNIKTSLQAKKAFNKAKEYNKGRSDNISLMYLTKKTC